MKAVPRSETILLRLPKMAACCMRQVMTSDAPVLLVAYNQTNQSVYMSHAAVWTMVDEVLKNFEKKGPSRNLCIYVLFPHSFAISLAGILKGIPIK